MLVIGGGELADAVRELDRRTTLDAVTAHWMAIRAMQVHGFVFCQLLSTAEWVTDSCHWLERPQPGVHRRLGVVAIEEFLRTQEPHQRGTTLPVGWHVTSDSIAARLAEVVQAEELVLLKSTLPSACPNPLPRMQAVTTRLVDEYFPTAAARLSQIRIVNLRATDFVEVRLAPE